ncbi:MAG: T9SS type A sorting domain-containing protein [Bacteroidota bacterium]
MIKLNSITRGFLLILTLHLFWANKLTAQVDPTPCTDPFNNDVGCFCETAGLICSPDQLDGFEFTLPNAENYGDLGDGTGGDVDDLCPTLPDGGVPNNVSFIAFIAWCEDLTFDVLISNCTDNPLDPFETYGVQMAVFANCPALNGGNWDPLECITNGDEACFDTAEEVPPIQTFSISGLEVGGTYYLMFDGCALSTCNIAIDVQGVCGTGQIDEWENGIFGAQMVCLGANETYTAEDVVEGLDGAEEYYYYLDGILIQEGEEQYTIDITWDTPGTYELCVDVSNMPCVSELDFPPANCIQIQVGETNGGGDIQANPATLCPNETSTILVSNTDSNPTLSEYIVVVNPSGVVVQVVEGLITMLTFDKCGIFTAYYYSFTTADNLPVPTIGESWTLPDCEVNCCTLNELQISFEDAEAPEFTNPPADFTSDCLEDVITDEELVWTDNCAGTGSVQPVVIEDYGVCDGGTIDKIWTFTDSCGNTTMYTQVITFDPIPVAEFLSLPSDITISCEEAQSFLPVNLEYSNMANGICEISGSVMPTVDGTFDLCGGSVTYNWEFMDLCNRVIFYSQDVEVEPIAPAIFINPPVDITLNCEEIGNYSPDTLMYTNGSIGSCLIEGSVNPMADGSPDICGNTIGYSWEYTDVCGQTILHVQTVTIEPIEQATFIDPPADITLSCDEIGSYTPGALTYTNGGSGNCLLEGTVDPTITGMSDICGGTVTYSWEYTDVCGQTILHVQTVTIEPISEPSFIDPPADITIACDEIDTFIPDTLMYTNGGTGNCQIAGAVSPTADGSLDTCGVEVTYIWEYIDLCQRIVTHSQTVTVEGDVIHSVYSTEDNSQIHVFPNPFKDQVTIDERDLRTSDILIYDINGENVNDKIRIYSNFENVVIETSNLKSGIYILKVRTDVKLIYKY